jgi:hypothetical protein
MTTLRGTAPFWLDPDNPDVTFPDVELALKEPDGLLAIGGDLSTSLAQPTEMGFSWYGPASPSVVVSGSAILPPRIAHLRSLRGVETNTFTVTLDEASKRLSATAPGLVTTRTAPGLPRDDDGLPGTAPARIRATRWSAGRNTGCGRSVWRVCGGYFSGSRCLRTPATPQRSR